MTDAEKDRAIQAAHKYADDRLDFFIKWAEGVVSKFPDAAPTVLGVGIRVAVMKAHCAGAAAFIYSYMTRQPGEAR